MCLIGASSSAMSSINIRVRDIIIDESNLCYLILAICREKDICHLCAFRSATRKNKLRNDDANLNFFSFRPSLPLSLPENKLGAHFFRSLSIVHFHHFT